MGSGQTTLRNKHFPQECTHINVKTKLQRLPQNLPDETDNQGEEQTLVENHEPVLSNIIEDKTSAIKRTITKYCIPCALTNLQSFNNPGLKKQYYTKTQYNTLDRMLMRGDVELI